MKHSWRIAAILIILLVCVNLVAFLIPFEKTAVFWVSEIFAVVAIAAQYPVSMLSKHGRGSDIKSRFYGWPIMKVGIVYMTAVLASAILFMLISLAFSGLPIWFVLVVYIIETGCFGIGLIAVESTRNYVEGQDEKIKTITNTMKEMRIIVDQTIALCSDDEIIKKLNKLSEDLRYSDPVSSQGTTPVETRLMGVLMQVQSTAEDDPEQCAKYIDEATRVLALRNKVCKESKYS